MREDWVFENYLLGESVEDIVENYVGLQAAEVRAVIDFAVRQLIENRIREDSFRSECAVETPQAA